MKRAFKKNRKLMTLLPIGAVCLLVITVLLWAGAVSAADNVTIKSVAVTYTDGAASGTALGENGLFTDVSATIEADISGCITLPGPAFDDVITSATLSGDQKLDGETFYFDTYSESALNGGTLWAYTFTGWHIVGQTAKLPSETVFQPGDVITPEVLESYADVTDAATGAAALQLEALWGKCYFIRNPYTTMEYKDYTRYIPSTNGKSWEDPRQIIGLSTKDSTGPTGAWDAKELEDGSYTYNRGNDPANPLASIDFLYQGIFTGKVAVELGDASGEVLVGDPYDAYSTAVVLTGDLDYVLDQHTNLSNNAFLNFNEANMETFRDSFVKKFGDTASFDDVVAYANLEASDNTPGGWRTGFIASDGSFYRDQDGVIGRHTAVRAFGNRTDAPAVTFKSLQETDGTTYTFYFKPYNDECNVYASMRFDNVRVEAKRDGVTGSTIHFKGENVGRILRFYNSTRSGYDEEAETEYYFETTRRMTTPTATYNPFCGMRAWECERLTLNGGIWDYVCVSWSDANNTDSDGIRYWNFGGSMRAGTVYAGVSDTEDTYEISGDVYITVTETDTSGTTYGICSLWAGGKSADFTHYGNRTVRIYDDGPGGRTLRIGRVYGGSFSAPIYGDVDILISGVAAGTNAGLGDVYGGGMNYTANVYGDINVRVVKSALSSGLYIENGLNSSGTLYGGGQYGSCMDDPASNGTTEGAVTVSVVGSSVAGTVYGSGSGNLNTIVSDDTDNCGMLERPDDWQTPPTGFPEMSQEDKSIVWHVTKNLSWKTGSNYLGDGVLWIVKTTRAAISTASVQSADITIENSTVSGSVYGGGLLGLVKGDTSVAITGSSTVGGNVYGGGDGTGTIAPITLYAPIPKYVEAEGGSYALDENGEYVAVEAGAGTHKLNYEAPEPVINGTAATFDNGTTQKNNSGDQKGMSLGKYNWVNDPAMLTQEWIGAEGTNRQYGIDHDNSLIYFDMTEAGQVFGSTSVTIDSSKVSGTVYGGGNAGGVEGTATVEVTNGSTTSAGVYGGGNAGEIKNSGGAEYATTVTITDSHIQSKSDSAGTGGAHGGGKAGAVRGSTSLTVENCDYAYHLAGGGFSGVVYGNTNVTIKKATALNGSDCIVGGGNKDGSTVTGNVVLTVEDCDVGHSIQKEGYIFSGGNASDVKGSISATIKNTKVNNSIFGGGNAGNVGGSVTLTVEGSQLGSDIIGGGNDGDVALDTNVTISDTAATHVYGGGEQGSVGGSTYVTIHSGTFSSTVYGGGSEGAVTKNTSLTISGGSFGNSIHGGGKEKTGTVGGNTNVTISGLENLAVTVYGGGNAGAVTGTANVTITDTTYEPLTTNVSGSSDRVSVFGGGNKAGVGSVVLKLTNVTVDRPAASWSSTSVWDGAVYGGGNEGAVTGNVDITIQNCKIIANIIGGGNKAAAKVGGKITINATDLLNATGYDLNVSKPECSFYGGGRQADAGDIEITVTDGIYDWFYGGGQQGDAGNITITMLHDDGTGNDYLDDTENRLSVGETQPLLNACLRGGSDSANAKHVKVVIKGGWYYRNFHAAGNAGVTDSSEVEIYDGDFRSGIYGGGDAGAVLGKSSVAIYGAENFSSGIYGGSDRPNSRVGQSSVLIAPTGKLTINQNVFGGCNRGWVVAPGESTTALVEEGTSELYTVQTVDPLTFTGDGTSTLEIRGGTLTAAVYAGSNGTNKGSEQNEAEGQNEFGNIANGTKLIISGGKISASVYTGNNAAGTIGTGSKAEISGGTVDSVYGGNNGGSKLGAVVDGDAEITVTGGSITYVFGGNNAKGTVAGTARITTTGGTVSEIYGGNNKGGTVGTKDGDTLSGGTEINIKDGSGVTYAFGGSNAGGIVNGTVAVNVSGSVVDSIYGGNYSGGTINGTVNVNITGGEIDTQVVGGCHTSGVINGVINVNMSGGKVYNRLIGGGYKAPIEAGTVTELNVNLSGGEIYATRSGGNCWTFAAGYQADVAVVPNLTVSGTAKLRYVMGGGCGVTENNIVYPATCPGTNVLVSGGSISGLFGGGNDSVSVVDGRNSDREYATYIRMTGGKIGSIRGGGNLGKVYGNTYVEMTGGEVTDRINGGGNKGTLYGDTTVIVTGGEVANIYGGGDSTDKVNATVDGSTSVTVGGTAVVTGFVYGGGHYAPGVVTGDTVVSIEDGAVIEKEVYGGGYESVTQGNATMNISGGTLASETTSTAVYNIYGGGYRGDVLKSASINMTGGKVGRDLFGGGCQANVGGNTSVTVSGGTVVNSTYGGGNAGDVAGDVTVLINETADIHHLYGGGYEGDVVGGVNMTIDGATISGEVNGGGYGGEVESVTMRITGDTVHSTVGSSYRIYGGGKTAAVRTNVDVVVESGTFNTNFYGGGKDGKVLGDVSLTVLSGTFAANIYGGGQNASVRSTDVRIGNASGAVTFSGDTSVVTVSGDIFGGGEGATADVEKSTNVVIDMAYDFEAQESLITTNNITPSGQIATVITEAEGTWGVIQGSVYGGGDLGRVGNGTITVGGESATVTVPGATTVVVENGKIMGSVFGGGSGITEKYTYYMGVVFGSTDVDVNGGRILGNVYGGGRQSRVYADTKAENAVASNVAITEIAGKKIAIGGSVFGGGDRGEGTTTNATIPTTVGDVSVLISGIKDEKPSHVYFEGIDGQGGVYGDGNLCLVDGYRLITLLNFEPAEDTDGRVKTFYSLQRADKVVMDNSAVVLLGAPDLVDENDTGKYSVNRVDEFVMQNGSAVKLDQVVKYLGSLSSDVDKERLFIHDGVNGFTGTYPAEGSQQTTKCTCKELNKDVHSCNCLDPLTDAEIAAYRAKASDTKNVVCVANGLYLEVMGQDDEYGPVTGLFTLQLLFANPGEGGGFVYGSIPESTGDFICETQRWSFEVVSVKDAAEFETLKDSIYVRVAGKAFQRPTSYSETQTYYKRSTGGSEEYMDIIDDVGGLEGTDYAYYYWFIGGPSITYNVDVTGYIGTTKTAFPTDSMLPQHKNEAFSYVLYGVSVNDAFGEAVMGDGSKFELVQTATGLTGEQIAIEIKLGNESLGFLKWNETKHAWVILQGSNELVGYTGDTTKAAANNLITTKVDASNDNLTWVLHKSSTVSTTIAGLEVYLDLDLHSGTGDALTLVKEGTSMLSYTADIEIVRLVPIQSVYQDNLRSYTGVGISSNIHITGNSSFTMEYQTTYVPAAFPKTDTKSMYWALTTVARQYYMTESGLNLTVDPATGAVLAWSETISEENIHSDGNGGFYYQVGSDETTKEAFVLQGAFEGKNLPKNTKITMVDLTGSTPEYYYYICATSLEGVRLDNFRQMGTDTTISSMVSAGNVPAFMQAYNEQEMDQVKERLLFILDFEQAEQTTAMGFNSAGTLESGILLQHFYSDTDIMNYSRKGADGKYARAYPKEVKYLVNNASKGVNSTTYTAAFQAAQYDDLGTAVINVAAQEDPNWINTIFRENGFALKIQLVDASGNALAMPAGMFFEYKGQHFSPGPDSTYVAVPVYEFGDHEITIHNPYFSLRSVAGDTAYFKVSYYSAPDATYYNSFDTGVSATASYTVIGNTTYALKVDASATPNRVLSSGDSLKFTVQTMVNGEDSPQKVTASLLMKGENGAYEAVELRDVLNVSGNTFTAGTQTWKVTGTEPGTYRIVLTYGGHAEYLNFIIQ